MTMSFGRPMSDNLALKSCNPKKNEIYLQTATDVETKTFFYLQDPKEYIIF